MAVSFLILIFLQYRLWVGDGSISYIAQIKQEMSKQKQENDELAKRNQALEAEVNDLKQGMDVVEEQARGQLGMIKQNEIFYQYIEEPMNSEPATP